MNKNKQYECRGVCQFHPNHPPIVGVCPFCLNERLLSIAAHRRHHHLTFPNIFARIGPLTLLNCCTPRRPSSSHYQSTSTSLQDDSFISIQFGENGVALWDNNNSSSKTSQHHSNKHPFHLQSELTKQSNWKPNGNRESLRWRERIGRLLHNKPTKACITTLNFRRTNKQKNKG